MVMEARLDLHVHTARYSGCAEYATPTEIGRRAAAAGLAGVVLADHDFLWEAEERDALAALSPGVRLFRGIEVSTSGGHVVVVGLEDAGALPRGVDFGRAIDVAHAQGAAVILAHPYRDGDPERWPLERVDALEVASTSFSRETAARARALCERLHKPGVAASDAHALSRIGWAWTAFPGLPSDEGELARMISAGLGRPAIPRPFPS
jgi:predicted metal-dependent phosphoesterase TrpH